MSTNEPKWTPGPWTVGREIFDNYGLPESVITALDGRATVGVALDFGGNNQHWREANARLITAAPDLYDVVAYAVKGPGFDSETFEKMARAALSKALGE